MKTCKYREFEKDWILRENIHVRIETARKVIKGIDRFNDVLPWRADEMVHY